MEASYRTATEGQWLTVRIPDQGSFEALREALDDPVWLVGASFHLLTTNEFKRGRFDDAFGAYVRLHDGEQLAARLTAAGIDAECAEGPPPHSR